MGSEPPQTPELLSIPSPDLTSFQNLIRSPIYLNLNSENIPNLQLQDDSGLDFDTAYKLFTSFQSPSQQQHHHHDHQHNLNKYKSELDQQLQELNTQISFKTDETIEPNQLDLSFSDDLLSAKETSAIERLLDSIVEPSTASSSATPQLAVPTEVSSTTTPPNDEQPPDQPHDDDTKRKKSSSKYVKKRRRLLTEEEKKNNHINSEQKRRNIIKDAYDDLLSLLPPDAQAGDPGRPKAGKRKPPKSILLEKIAAHIENLQSINSALKQQLSERQSHRST